MFGNLHLWAHAPKPSSYTSLCSLLTSSTIWGRRQDPGQRVALPRFRQGNVRRANLMAVDGWFPQNLTSQIPIECHRLGIHYHFGFQYFWLATNSNLISNTSCHLPITGPLVFVGPKFQKILKWKNRSGSKTRIRFDLLVLRMTKGVPRKVKEGNKAMPFKSNQPSDAQPRTWKQRQRVWVTNGLRSMRAPLVRAFKHWGKKECKWWQKPPPF